MRHARSIKLTVRSSAITKIGGSGTPRLAAIVAVLAGAALLAAAVRAYNHATLDRVSPTKPSAAVRLLQGNSTLQQGSMHARLSFQPEANRVRRRLGQRFLVPGHERATIVGTLTLGAQQYPVRILRTQNDDGERVDIALDGGPTLLSWSATEGARSGSSVATGSERVLIERLVLDSPDQFIQAQLRGASYYTVARNAMPAEAKASDDYSGPVWDLVRVGEPSSYSSNRPVSLSRLYYINSSTGLIDKIAYEEKGETVTAEVSDWISQAGETEPTRIIWKTNNQVLMQLTVNNIAHAAK
jgi:hypothetical protein